jgi:hypothetical protein
MTVPHVLLDQSVKGGEINAGNLGKQSVALIVGKFVDERQEMLLVVLLKGRAQCREVGIPDGHRWHAAMIPRGVRDSMR